MPRPILPLLFLLAGLPFAGCQSHTAQVAAIVADATLAPLPAPSFGDPAPVFKPAGWYQGAPQDLAQRDKVIVFYLQELSYAHTRRAVARIESLYRKFSPEGLVVVGVESEFKDAEWRKSIMSGIREKDVTFPIAELGDNADKAWDDRSIFYYPRTLVIKNGIVIWSGNAFALTDTLVGDMIAGRYETARAEKEKQTETLRYSRMKRLAALLQKETDAGRWESAMDIADKYLATLSENERFVEENARGLAMNGTRFDPYIARKLQSQLTLIQKDIDEGFPGAALARLEALQRNPWYEDHFALRFFTPMILGQVDRAKMRDFIRKNILADNDSGKKPGESLTMIFVVLGGEKKPAEDIALARELLALAKQRGAEADDLDYYGASIDLMDGKVAPAEATFTRLASGAKKEEIRKNAANVLKQLGEKKHSGRSAS